MSFSNTPRNHNKFDMFFDGLSVLKREFWSETIFIKKNLYYKSFKEVLCKLS